MGPATTSLSCGFTGSDLLLERASQAFAGGHEPSLYPAGSRPSPALLPGMTGKAERGIFGRPAEEDPC
jgi:hypothetical protein